MSEGTAICWYVIVACLCLESAVCLPTNTDFVSLDGNDARTNGSVLTTLGDSMFNSFEDVATFLQKWFRLITNKIAAEENHVTGTVDNAGTRSRRETKMAAASSLRHSEVLSTQQAVTGKPAFTFEDLEKQYLINKTINLLEQMYFYSDYVRRLTEEKHSAETATTRTPTVSVTPTPVTKQTTGDGNRGLNHMLAAKLQELKGMTVAELNRVFHNVRNAAQNGMEDTDISRVCCPLG